MKKEETNGAVNRRRVLPGTREIMEESKKTGKKETMKKSWAMEAGKAQVRMSGEPLE